MTTNILNLPMLGPATAISLVTNADWNDSIFFGAVGSTNTTVTLADSTIASGNNSITVSSTSTLQPGMPIYPGLGIPAGAYVGAITGLTAFSMVDGSGDALNATASSVTAFLTFFPVPLDLTGIEFEADLKTQGGGLESFLTLSTVDASINNGGTSGILAFNVPYPGLGNIFPGAYVMDIVAIADGHTINLFPKGPATVTIEAGVTAVV